MKMAVKFWPFGHFRIECLTLVPLLVTNYIRNQSYQNTYDNIKSCFPSMKKSEKGSVDFWCRKMTFESVFRSQSQNMPR